jgi:iron complex outermembrane receptor protein
MQYGSLNNTDIVHNTYFGTASFFVVDTRIKYQLTKQLSLSGGIDNINNNKYFIFHPFPQRTYMAELKFNY